MKVTSGHQMFGIPKELQQRYWFSRSYIQSTAKKDKLNRTDYQRKAMKREQKQTKSDNVRHKKR